jgi:hypothetical protein
VHGPPAAPVGGPVVRPRDYEQEERDRRAFEARTRHLRCHQCGGMDLQEREGSDTFGLPGVTYAVCAACGWSQAKTKRSRRRRRLE